MEFPFPQPYLCINLRNLGACYTTLVGILKCMAYLIQLHLALLMPVRVTIQQWYVHSFL